MNLSKIYGILKHLETIQQLTQQHKKRQRCHSRSAQAFHQWDSSWPAAGFQPASSPGCWYGRSG